MTINDVTKYECALFMKYPRKSIRLHDIAFPDACITSLAQSVYKITCSLLLIKSALPN